MNLSVETLQGGNLYNLNIQKSMLQILKLMLYNSSMNTPVLET